MGKRYRRWRLLALLAAVALLATSPVVTATSLEGTLRTPGELTIDGSLAGALDEGVLHLRESDLSAPTLSLQASALEVRMAWTEGYRSEVDGDQARYETGGGEERFTLRDAQARLIPDQAQVEVLAILVPGGRAQATATSPVGSTVGTVEDLALTQVEWSDEARSARYDPPGFWYHVDGPWVRTSGLADGRVTGSFDLFVNNVTLQVAHADGTWEEWTGYRERAPGSPVSRFETRVTVLHVEDGRLDLHAPGAVSLLGPQSQAHVSGSIQARQAVGELLSEERRYAFHEARLELQGEGQLHFSAGSAGSSARGVLQQEKAPWTQVTTQGEYTVTQAPGVVATPVETGVPGPNWGWVAVAGLALAAGIATWRWSTRFLGFLHATRAQARRQRLSTWMGTGDKLVAAREYEEALAWYKRVTRQAPAHVEAWYAQGLVLRELGQPAEAAEAYEEANRRLGGDDPELLDLAAAAWLEAGNRQRAKDLWETLATVEPGRLQRRLDEPRLLDGSLEAWVRELLGPDEATKASYI